jgi:hypothetical protein
VLAVKGAGKKQTDLRNAPSEKAKETKKIQSAIGRGSVKKVMTILLCRAARVSAAFGSRTQNPGSSRPILSHRSTIVPASLNLVEGGLAHEG